MAALQLPSAIIASINQPTRLAIAVVGQFQCSNLPLAHIVNDDRYHYPEDSPLVGQQWPIWTPIQL